MKTRNIITLVLLFATLSIFAQNFPGEDVSLLVDKELKVLPKAESLQDYGYDGFYKDYKLKRKYACCQSYNSKYKALENKTFRVISFDPYTNGIGTKKYKLHLENEEIGLIYFDYSSEYEHSFPFEVIGGLDYPKDFWCKDIEETKDKFSEKVTFNTPILEPISFMKVKDEGQINTYMSIRISGSTANVGETGAIILLSNGEKIEKPNAKIKARVSKYVKGFEYSTFINLTDNDISTLKTTAITDVRLYIYDSEIKDGEKFKEYLKCISEK